MWQNPVMCGQQLIIQLSFQREREETLTLPSVRSSAHPQVIMQPVRNQFELLKLPLTHAHTHPGGGGEDEGGGGGGVGAEAGGGAGSGELLGIIRA